MICKELPDSGSVGIKAMNKLELEERLIDFGVIIISLSEQIRKNRAGDNLSRQIVRSGTSPALNYGVSRSAESLKDFIHKLQLVLKELRETHVALRLIHRANLYRSEPEVLVAIDECDQLISIFVRSIQTSKKKL